MGASAVTFGAVPSASFKVDSATQITAEVPTGALTGAVSVTTPAGVATSTSSFTVTGDFSAAKLSAVLGTLKKHLTGEVPLTEGQIKDAATTFLQNAAYLNTSEIIIQEVFDLVDTYDSVRGALFISEDTKSGFVRTATTEDGLEIARAMIIIQQAILDYVYSASSVETFKTLLEGRAFRSAAYFPGAAVAPSDPTPQYEVPVNCTLPAYWGKPVFYATDAQRRPTGLYLAPGSLGTVTVPSSLVNAGYSVLVGAHTWDKTSKSTLLRLDRVITTFPITSETTHIANPLGGGIYLIVPNLANLGVVNIQVANVIKAPFFSLTRTKAMTNEAWKTERANPGPWTDFETDKYMMTLPTSWIYAYEDPLTLMQNWDKAMDGESELLGYPLDRGRTVLYQSVDVSIAHTAYGIGYPMVNYDFNPSKLETGNKAHDFLKGPLAWNITFHELSHAQLMSMFSGETEAIVNFPFVYISNVKFGNDLGSAFQASGYSPNMTRDQAAIDWMVAENFRNSAEMDTTNSTKNEMRYQSRGYAKYMDIVLLYGWQPLIDFSAQEQLDYINAATSDGLSSDDSRTLRLSKACGEDITPLIHFWGVHPEDPLALSAAVAAAALPKSTRIHDLLVYYQGIAPRNNADFKAQQLALYPDLPTGGNPDYGYGWYNYWAELFGEAEGTAIQTELQSIIDLYGLGQP